MAQAQPVKGYGPSYMYCPPPASLQVRASCHPSLEGVVLRQLTRRPLLRLSVQGVLQRAPDVLHPGQDFSQTLCFSEEAVQAEMRAKVTRARLCDGQDSVAEWLTRDCVVLVNDGHFMKAACTSDACGSAPPPVRPITAAVL